MDSDSQWIVPLSRGADWSERSIGGKAAKLARLAHAGFHVPPGFFVTIQAYEHFVQEQALDRLIRMELGRKSFATMRWEEIWDVALRIRSAFLAAPVPAELVQAITAAVEDLGPAKPLAVRSSAPGEDSANRSFAGLHESVVGVSGPQAVLDALRVVWSSLWSDAALLYRHELNLDPGQSRMAVVIQEMIDDTPSGVAFGRDPRDLTRNQAIIEAVPGPCGDLVDGLVDPDRWVMDRASGQVVNWRRGERQGADDGAPLLDRTDLRNLHDVLRQVETLFQWPPDTEWTGQGERFTLLQARPITTATPEGDDQRGWYLSLRPGMRRLNKLAQRVAGELIPKLEDLGLRLAREPIEGYSNRQLATAIEERQSAVEQWRTIYLEDFIPFAHGVRQLGVYYNDAVHPDDPYEFVGLLRDQPMVASRRNEALQALAEEIRHNAALGHALEKALAAGWRTGESLVASAPGGRAFLQRLDNLQAEFMDVAYDGERLFDRPELILRTVLEMTKVLSLLQQPAPVTTAPVPVADLEQRLLSAVGPRRREEAQEMLSIGRLSWRLRDDDNVLVGRLESQLLRALELAADRLRAAGRLPSSAQVSMSAAPVLADALRNPHAEVAELPPPQPQTAVQTLETDTSPRQLVGQPAAPGMATGRVQPVRDAQDLGRFRAGSVLVCDAIQPTMTHLVPLACAIVERRGGMLIHGAIIARELGIPCVNGIANAVDLLPEGEIVTVDGYLGIVTVGEPELDLEVL